MLKLPASWERLLQDELQKSYIQQLEQFLEEEYATKVIYPPKEKIFTALELTSFEDVRVVILGQDPYHGPNQAHGLSFSVEKGVAIPKSLVNMYKELVDDLKVEMPPHGNLENWAKQGVLMLNTVLTVRAGEANSHRNIGWEKLTDTIIQKLAERKKQVVFVLWGAPAQKKASIIEKHPQHIVLKAPHPSPLSAYRGFFGSKPYSTINSYLGDKPINWIIE